MVVRQLVGNDLGISDVTRAVAALVWPKCTFLSKPIERLRMAAEAAGPWRRKPLSHGGRSRLRLAAAKALAVVAGEWRQKPPANGGRRRRRMATAAAATRRAPELRLPNAWRPSAFVRMLPRPSFQSCAGLEEVFA